MNLKQACSLYRVSRPTLLSMCHKGIFGAKKEKGQWVLTRPPISEQCIGTKAIAETLGCSTRYVRIMCENGKIESIRVGRFWRVGVSRAARLFIYFLGSRDEYERTYNMGAIKK
jgi:excisionase family DNA binding protein